MANEFRFINQLALIDGVGVIPGQLLYLPEPICYKPELEDEIIRFIGAINERILFEMDNQQRRIIADNPAFVTNAAESPNIIVNGLSVGNAATGALISGISSVTRSIGESLKDLERAYQHSFRSHGRLTPDFYIRRTQIYQQLDTQIGRLGRMVALGTPFDERAKASLKVSSKSTVLQWRRHGVGPVAEFQGHFDRFATAARWLRFGGYATIAIDVALNEHAISNACKTGNEEHCSRQTYALRGKTAGAVAGGFVGGMLATYGVCNVVFGIQSVGTSLLWCALVAGGAGTTVGGMSGGKAGERGGDWLYERRF